ncbi:MAG: hypothetical protein ACRC2R_10855 [Xenococcaceae cyanobacterium]
MLEPIDEMQLKRLTLNKQQLLSTATRTFLGERTIEIDPIKFASPGGNIVTKVFDGLKRFGGFIVNAVRAIFNWALSDIFDWLVETYFELKYFDWNQTDAEIKAAIDANNAAIFGELGDLAGTGLVWFIGIGASTALASKYPVVAGEVALKLAQEGNEEIRARFTNLLRVTARSTLHNLALSGFLTIRKLRLFGLAPVTESKEPWIIADKIDNAIQKIPSLNIRAFVSRFLEAIEDNLIDMGYVICTTIEDHYALARERKLEEGGQQRTVILQPDKEVEDEKLVIEDDQNSTMQTVRDTLNTYALVHNRDVGQIIGQPYEDWYRAKPQRRFMEIIFKSKEKPPWREGDGKRASEYSFSIPDVKAGLTWNEIKTAAKKYTWGEMRVWADLDNGRQLVINASTKAEGISKIKELATLTTAKILKFSSSSEEDPPPERKKKATMAYPCYANLTIRKPTIVGEGIATIDGQNLKSAKTRIELWHDTEPEDSEPIPP